MTVKRASLPPFVLLGVMALAVTALLLVVSAPEAAAEPNDLYELNQVSNAHGARTVAVRADGLEVLVLESIENTTTRTYDNSLFRLVGPSLSLVRDWQDANWYWTFAAFDPRSTEALLGGSYGTLMSYDGGVVNIVGGISSATVTAVDWHPRDDYAFVGTNYGIIYRYEDDRVSTVGSYSYIIDDIDFAPNGSEAAFACYDLLYIYNTSRGEITASFDSLQIEDEWYDYVYAVEYNRDSSYLYVAWDSWKGSNTLFRLRGQNWNKVASMGNDVDRMVFETEGSFLLCVAQQSVIVIETNFGRSIPNWAPDPKDGNVLDVAIDDHGFSFLFGNSAGLFQYKRKPDVKPWLKTPVADASFNEDDAAGGVHLIDLLNYVADDRSVNKLRFEVDHQGDPAKLEVRVDGHYLDFVQKVPNWFGKANFRIRVLDRGYDDIALTTDDNLNRTNFFNVTVKPVNDPITLLKVGDLVVGEDSLVFFIQEGVLLELPLDVFDVDMDTPRFTFNRSLPSMKVVAPSGPEGMYLLWFQPRNKDVGNLFINLTVTDGMGSTDHANLVFYVRNVNNPPRLMGLRDMTVNEDSWLNFTIWAVDEDIEIGIENTLMFSTNRTDDMGGDDLPNFGFTVDVDNPAQIRVYFLPTNENVGDILVEFRVRDGFGTAGSWDDSKVMTIKVVNTNDAPVLTEVNGLPTGGLLELSLNAVEDQETTLNIASHDDDGDPITFYMTDGRFKLEHVAGTTTARVRFTPTNDDVGSVFATLSVWDNHNTYDELRLNLTVENVNDPPVIQVFEARTVGALTRLEFQLWEDQEFLAPIVVLDVDSDVLSFTETEGVFTITVDPNDPHRATFSWTPVQDDVGTRETTVSVDDGDGGKATLNVVLTVMNVNDPPSRTTLTQQNFESPVMMRATAATDSEGDTLTYVWDFGDFTLPQSGEGLVQVTHTYARWGTYRVTVTVKDGNGGESVSTLDIIVQQTTDEGDPVEVQRGPVALIIALTVAIIVVALVMMVIYMRSRPRAGGGGEGA